MMPMDPTTAKTTLGNLFATGAGDEATARAAWAQAMEDLCTDIVPASTTVAAAAATLETALTGFNAPGAAQALFDTALLAFVITVGGGMAGFTPTPPIAPTGLTYPEEDDAQDAADAIIDTVHTWLQTGTAQAAGGPPPPPVNWS